MVRYKFKTIPPQEEDCTGKVFIVTGSNCDAAYGVRLPVQGPNIFEGLDAQTNVMQHYSNAKLIQIMFMTKLAEAVDSSGKGHILVNVVHPGFCGT
ncbi:uncharacterized protein FTOL_12600 [Fusarium torulosum]|uniref:Uncharacterized protein n=1 Tax=Fusarium torulosum TaxID=33205 RepID=A0AAE8SP09_9HYPO|nr:uncharacterized protein FTOL_12600 [Fusarium torulosum]